MTKNSLFSSQGSFLIGVDMDEANKVDILDLVKAKKAADGTVYAPRYDMNSDGAVDEEDVTIIKKQLFKTVD